MLTGYAKSIDESSAKLTKIQSRISSLTEKLKQDFGLEKEFYSMVDVSRARRTSTHTRFALSKKLAKLRATVQIVWESGINLRIPIKPCNFQMAIIAGMGQIEV